MLEFFVLLPVGLLLYAYVVYPILLGVLALAKSVGQLGCRSTVPPILSEPEWPTITVTVPCHNAEQHIATTLEAILAAEYPHDRRQVLVISDASTDATDTVIAQFAGRGVEFLRLPERQGKSAAENASIARARGDIIVNVDATIQLAPQSLRALAAAFADPTVGIASGYDVCVVRHQSLAQRLRAEHSPGIFGSVGMASPRPLPTRHSASTPDVQAEGYYVNYEMNVRTLETRVKSIIGASGCFYAVRRSLYDSALPLALTRDFAAVLHAYERGFRAVSVPEAICFVPRSASRDAEMRRKTRTMAGGLQTLIHFKHLLNPVRSGLFAWMLFSHKLCRWLVYLDLPRKSGRVRDKHYAACCNCTSYSAGLT